MAKFLFDSDEEFNLFMGNTLAYNNMQNIVSRLVSFIRPQYLIEFGSGSGATSSRLATENPSTSIVAVDLREKMVGLASDSSSKNKIKNVTFVNGDLTKLDNYNLSNANLILLMYSFKYISDPVEVKYQFLENIYNKMQSGAYLIIGETFVDDDMTKQQIRKQLEDTYYNNSKDVFWDSLHGLTPSDIQSAFDAQTVNREHTKEQIELGVNRDGVYYVSRQWLLDTAKKIGFKVLIGERLNSLSDAIFVMTKE